MHLEFVIHWNPFVIPTFVRRCCSVGIAVHEQGSRSVAEGVDFLEDIVAEPLVRAPHL